MNIELDANLKLIDLINNLEIIDLSAIANNLDLTSNIVEDALIATSSVPEIISDSAISDLASNISETELTATESIKDSIANIAEKAVVRVTPVGFDITAQILGSYAKFVEPVSYSEEIIKILDYTREYFEDIFNKETLSMTLTRPDFDNFLQYDSVDIKPIKHTNEIVMVSELVTEQLIFNFTKYLYETVKAVEFVDYFVGNQRGSSDGYRGYDKVSLHASHYKADTKQSFDNTLLTVYKNIHDSAKAIDRILGDAAAPYGVSEQKHPLDSLQIILHDYFLEEYVSFDYVGANYLIQG